MTRGVELEHRAVVVSSSLKRRAVQVASGVLNQTSIGSRPIGAAGGRAKAVEHCLVTRSIHLEHRAIVDVSAAVGCGAVQVTRSVLDQTSLGLLTVRAIPKRARGAGCARLHRQPTAWFA